MGVNVEIIRDMKPCEERFDKNFLVYYPEFDGTFEQFLDLDKITYADKIWVARRLLNKNQLVHWAVLCAQSVLSIYENKYPNDNRVRDCIEYLTTITDFSNLTNEQLIKLRELRGETADAYTDAYAAAYAYVDAYAAADAADYAAKENQKKLNLQFLLIASKL